MVSSHIETCREFCEACRIVIRVVYELVLTIYVKIYVHGMDSFKPLPLFVVFILLSYEVYLLKFTS
jgi:hypothetical protein